MGMKSIRTARGLTHRDLADMLDITASTVTRAENRSPGTTLRTYQKIADALGVQVVDLLMEDRTASEMDLLRAFRELPPDRQTQMISILRLMLAPPPASEAGTAPAAPASDDPARR